MVSDEQRLRYSENRRKKYHSDPTYQAKRAAERKAWWDTVGTERRRERYRNDPEYRERVLAPRRGRDQRNSQLRTHYGITLAQYNAMLEAQGHACAICRTNPGKTLHVDHCHKSERVRALLCDKCNIGLGSYRDDPELLRKAAAYLEGFR